MIKSCTDMAHLHLCLSPKLPLKQNQKQIKTPKQIKTQNQMKNQTTETKHFPTVSTVNSKVYKVYFNHGFLIQHEDHFPMFFPSRIDLPSSNTLHVYTASLPLLCTLITESQKHKMWGVRRDRCGSSTPLPKQGHPEQAAQHHVQGGLEYLQRRRLHNLPGQPVPVLRHPQREEVLPHVQPELPVLQFVPVAPCPVTGHH